jgi:NAD(P)-dependent dehydrogenase (short-subunit alcohol dehydrogenase family)
MEARSRRRWCSAAIIGAGSGLGRELAIGFAAKGCMVFGTCGSPDEVQDLRAASGGRVSLAVSDITRFTKGKVWAAGVSDALDGAGLEILINIAGFVPPGPIEAISLDAARHVLEENVLGAMSIINAFLPALRRSRGRIVQIIEASAGAPIPFHGLPATTSAALEALLAAYRADLKPFGIDVTVALVGRMRAGCTDAMTSAAKAMMVGHRELYGRRLAAFANRADVPQTDPMNASEAAARLIEIAEQEPAPSRIAVGADAEAIFHATRHLSDDQLDAMRMGLTGTS